MVGTQRVARSIALFCHFRGLPECSDSLAKYLRQMSQSFERRLNQNSFLEFPASQREETLPRPVLPSCTWLGGTESWQINGLAYGTAPSWVARS